MIFIIRLVIKVIKRQTIGPTVKIVLIIIISYSLIWLAFYFNSKRIEVPFGTEMCFDDWCATIIDSKKVKSINTQTTNETFVILRIKLINKAKRIAQKPSMPVIKIVDDDNNVWLSSDLGQRAYEVEYGRQERIDKKLQLNEVCVTHLVFEIPSNENKIYALIEEGPFITKLFIKGDEMVFKIKE